MRRVSLWFLIEETPTRNLIYVLLAAPIEHLMQQIQSLEDHGPMLRDLCRSHSNPFVTCLDAYFRLASRPAEFLEQLLWVAMPKGWSYVRAVFHLVVRN